MTTLCSLGSYHNCGMFSVASQTETDSHEKVQQILSQYSSQPASVGFERGGLDQPETANK